MSTLYQAFKEKLSQCRKKAACGRYYVDTNKLRDWMSIVESGRSYNNATRLFVEVFSSNRSRPDDGPRPASQSILSGPDSSLLVFSILLDLGYGHFIDLFHKAEIFDRRIAHAASLYNDLQERFSRIQCYELAVKSYSDSGLSKELFEKETKAFNWLRGQEGMVQYLGQYSHDETKKDGSTLRTHNILLEFGESDLEEYFAEVPPPVRRSEIIDFWKSLFNVAEYLKKIHFLEHRNEDNYAVKLSGQHSDLKPANILRVHDKFKLCDFGFTKFARADSEALAGIYEGGTATYGPPETSLRMRKGYQPSLTQSIDAWCFGCVLSESATWVILGESGVAQYIALRKQATKTLRQKQGSGEDVNDVMADDAFHDGNNVLPEIGYWHEYLRRVVRASDPISCHLLDLVDKRMLLSEPHQRITSKDLCEELGKLVSEEPRAPTIPATEEPHDKVLAVIKGFHETYSEVSKSARTSYIRDAQTKAEAQLNGNINVLTERQGRQSSRIGKSIRLDRAKATNRMRMTEKELDRHISSHWSKPIPAPRQDNEAPRALPKLKESLVEDNKNNEENATENGNLTAKTNETTLSNPRQAPSRKTSSQQLLPPIIRRTSNQIAEAKIVPGDSASKVELGTSNSSIVLPTDHEQSPNLGKLMDARFHHADSIAPRNAPVAESENSLSLPPPLSPNAASSPSQTKLVNSLDIYKTRMEMEQFNRDLRFLRKSRKDEHLKHRLEARDITFLVDNGTTMRSHWDVATFVLETLTMKLIGLDEDGLDLRFTIGTYQIDNARGFKAAKKFKEAMTNPTVSDLEMAKTNMSESLGRIFDEYFRSPKQKQRTLIVLTDGIWEGSVKDKSVEKKIVDCMSKLRQRNVSMVDRQYTIQFIRFGDDPEAIRRLNELDDNLESEYHIP
ncbi:MAG: hypothetical protein Q9160_002645 [Pyrenula sp. 1 TL-2023]